MDEDTKDLLIAALLLHVGGEVTLSADTLERARREWRLESEARFDRPGAIQVRLISNEIVRIEPAA